MWDYTSREIAETAWREYWDELQTDDELIRLYEQARQQDREVQAEADRLVASGECEEILF